MKQNNITLIATCCVGLLTGGVLAILVMQQHDAPFSQSKVSFVDLVAQMEPNMLVEWTEFKKGERHAGVAWVQDTKHDMARIYVYLMANEKWTLTSKKHLAFKDIKLDYVDIMYPYPLTGIVDTDGISRDEIRLWGNLQSADEPEKPEH